MRAIRYRDGIREVEKQYPRMDMGVIQGLEDGLEWKLIVESQKPPYNSDLERLKPTETPTNNPHDVYTHLNVVNVTWSIVRKSDAEIIQLIEDAESRATETLISHTDRLKFMFLYMAIVNRKTDGGIINVKMQAILDKGDAKAIKLWQNDTILENKLQQLSDGLDPDINTDWTNG